MSEQKKVHDWQEDDVNTQFKVHDCQEDDVNTQFKQLFKKRKLGEIPYRFTDANLFKSYGNQHKMHPRFWTTSSVYGSKGPTSSTLPEKYFGTTYEFSKHHIACGNYRNYSLNI